MLSTQRTDSICHCADKIKGRWKMSTDWWVVNDALCSSIIFVFVLFLFILLNFDLILRRMEKKKLGARVTLFLLLWNAIHLWMNYEYIKLELQLCWVNAYRACKLSLNSNYFQLIWSPLVLWLSSFCYLIFEKSSFSHLLYSQILTNDCLYPVFVSFALFNLLVF